MAKRKDRVGIDFNKLVLAILLQPPFLSCDPKPVRCYPLSFLFYYGLEVGGGGWSA